MAHDRVRSQFNSDTEITVGGTEVLSSLRDISQSYVQHGYLNG
jgi:hypothetical protein